MADSGVGVNVNATQTAASSASGDASSGGTTIFGNASPSDASFLGFSPLPSGPSGSTFWIVIAVGVAAYLVWRMAK